MEFKATRIERPTLEAISAVRPDYEVMLVTILETILARYERKKDYPFVDTKLSTITGADFGPTADPMRDFKGPGTIYAWIQGRGLEALVGHARWLGDCTILSEPERRSIHARIERMVREVMTRMEEIRAKNRGHVFFSMTTDGQALAIDDDGRLLPTSIPRGAHNLSDLFYAKGLFAAANFLGLRDKQREAEDYFREVCHDIEMGRFYSDQQAFDPKNKVRPIPGQHRQGPWMLAIGGLALLAEQTGADEWFAKGAAFVRHVLTRHLNRGQFTGLREYDFVEAVDAKGQPWVDGGRIICDPGHALEFIGLSTKLLLLMRARPTIPPDQVELLGTCRQVLPKLLLQTFRNGFNREAGGICKTFDLVARKPVNTDMPWWSLPETIRAAMLLATFVPEEAERTQLLEVVADCSNAFLGRFVNRRAHLMAYQTRNERGEPIDVIPGTPDADPGYHTGLSIIDFLPAVPA